MWYYWHSDIDPAVYRAHASATLDAIVDRLELADIDDTGIVEDVQFSVDSLMLRW